MADVKLDYSSIGSKAVNSIDNLISYLNKSINFLGQCDIPSDFTSKNAYSNILSNLKQKKNELNVIKSWLIDSNKNYDSMIELLDRQALNLPTYQVKKRNKII